MAERDGTEPSLLRTQRAFGHKNGPRALLPARQRRDLGQRVTVVEIQNMTGQE